MDIGDQVIAAGRVGVIVAWRNGMWVVAFADGSSAAFYPDEVRLV